MIDITVQEIPIGQDRLYVVTGGLAHIGAVATAYWNHGELKLVSTVLPHHREGELACYWAKEAAAQTKHTVTVMMGIHIDKATKEQIHLIVDKVNSSMEQALSTIR